MEYGSWTLLDTGASSAEKNMAIDSELLERQSSNPSQSAILHLYDWTAPSATYGYFIDPDALLDNERVQAHGLQLARRPTGGGVIFHLTDFAFSMVVPRSHPGYSVNILENYAFVNRIVIEIIKRFSGNHTNLSMLPSEPVASGVAARHFCMAKPTKYDVMVEGRKVGGGAQRRTKDAFLHQGTISLAFPDEGLLRDLLKPGTAVLEAMQANTHVLLGSAASPLKISLARKSLKAIFAETLIL